MSSALSNWHWLVDVPPSGAALLIAEGQVRHSALLPFSYELRATLDPGRLALQVAANSRQDARVEPVQQVDCALVPDARYLRDVAARPANFTRMLGSIRRHLIEKSGWYVGIETIEAGRGRAATDTSSWVASYQSRALRSAGFTRVLEYYVSDSPESPRNMIPADIGALRAWRRTQVRTPWRTALREVAILTGLHASLFRHRIVIARA